ncbi:probable LRR receptor-like serine/threonine-protein kinase At1g06840 isoform X2 [Pyrus communis]|uniref:probable LRR receptor-like serine/threonine-protein kinase At1g06840 isoform X2 n=1 Tax=Pyrus communis TaxID=23211 RepID=UPI0035C1FE1E
MLLRSSMVALQLTTLLLDNNLSGYFPPEFSELPSLLIFQVDNNNFGGSTIPDSYSNMSKLFKLSLRNCNLQWPIPDFRNKFVSCQFCVPTFYS